MLGVAQFWPRVGEIDKDLFRFWSIKTGESEPVRAYYEEIGEIFPKAFEPNLAGPFKFFLDSDPIEVGISLSPLPDPLPIAAAIFDENRLLFFEKRKIFFSVFILARHIEKSIEQDGPSVFPSEGND